MSSPKTKVWAQELKAHVDEYASKFGSLKTIFFSNCCGYEYTGFAARAVPIPKVLQDIMAELMPVCGILEKSKWPNGINVNYYANGLVCSSFHDHFYFHNFRNSKLGYHADNEALHFSQDRGANDSRHFVIGSFSLGSSRSFLVKHKSTTEITTLRLGQGDLIAMCGNFQDKFIHW